MSNNYLQEFKQIHDQLGIKFEDTYIAIQIQHQIYEEFISIFNKFHRKIAMLSNRINEEILAVQTDDTIINTYQFLSNCLLKMAQCLRVVAHKGKTQVLDPFVVFTNNYQTVNKDMISKLHGHIALLTKYDADLSKSRQFYISTADKLQKVKEMQQKTIPKSDRGDLTEFERFNSTLSKLAEAMNESEKAYHNNVMRINHEWMESKMHLNEMAISLEHNEESRISFVEKTVQSSIRLLEDLKNNFDDEVNKKLRESNSYMLQTDNKIINVDRKLLTKITLLSSTEISEEFISYDQINKDKRKYVIQEESPHLIEVFAKVRQNDKLIIQQIIKSLFKERKTKSIFKTFSRQPQLNKTDSNKSMKVLPKINTSNQIYSKRSKSPSNQIQNQIIKESISSRIELQIEQCRCKIITVQPYSFYFVEILYQKISEMSVYYLKISSENFSMMINLFLNITNNLIITDSNVQLIYKMMIISTRIAKKKIKTHQNQTVDLLSYIYGKQCNSLHNQQLLKAILKYIERKKSMKKKGLSEKSMVGMAKGFYAAMIGKKHNSLPSLNQQQTFNCLEEWTNLIANFSLPKQLIFPILKLNTHNQQIYQYFKTIIFTIRDQQERQRIFYGTNQQQKKQEVFAIILSSLPKMGIFALTQTAKTGFLGLQNIGLRLICKELSNIHIQILHRMKLQTKIKWPLLIPKKYLNYLEMKKEVEEKNIPASIQQIITLDVNRSLHLHEHYFNPILLQRLLKVYAYYHNDISYCQGMNYIAGYLYIKVLSQEEAYRIFQYVMLFRFHKLYINEFQNLKVKIYVFERLLSLFHPEISNHFKKQMITAECYAVSWMITLFSSTYQYTIESYMVDILWQRFIINGWSQFYRFVMWIFSLYKDNLLQCTYDKALNFLGELGRSQMFISSQKTFLTQFKFDINKEMQKYKITEQFLSKLQKQFCNL